MTMNAAVATPCSPLRGAPTEGRPYIDSDPQMGALYNPKQRRPQSAAPTELGEMPKSSLLGATELPVGTIWTVGHSTRSAEEFNHILRVQEIRVLVDVRSYPGSRRYPQFNKEPLKQSLTATGIRYQHSPALGGRRRPNPKSKNLAWKNTSFRAYADHLDSDEFKQGIKELLEMALKERTAVMCAEALWWRCHRSLIADYLKSLGWEVLHIQNEKQVEAHPYTSAARIVEGRLSYEGLF